MLAYNLSKLVTGINNSHGFTYLHNQFKCISLATNSTKLRTNPATIYSRSVEFSVRIRHVPLTECLS